MSSNNRFDPYPTPETPDMPAEFTPVSGVIARLETELAEARARLTESQAQNESRGLALLGEQKRCAAYIESADALHTAVAEKTARIAELEVESESRRQNLEFVRAQRYVSEQKCHALESRNAAEKAAAEFLREHGETLWTYLHDYDEPPKMPPALDRAIAALGSVLAALAPAPDAKGAVK